MLPIKIKLPEHFLDEEVRCDYTISSKMKELWAIELDLLSEIERVCKKYKLTYWANGGTMLGAVRHHGFIPWDDDIDIMMPRKDYNKLCEVANQEFAEPYFLQTEYSDPCSFRTHAQLRNSATAGILMVEINLNRKFNQGVFLDIFPLDRIPDKKDDFEQLKAEARKEYRKAAFFRDSFQSTFIISRHPKFFLKNTIQFLLKPISKAFYKELVLNPYHRYEEILSRYDDTDTKEFSLLIFNFASVHPRLRSDFEKTVYLDFEFTKVPVPYNYEDNLTRVFGDWHKFVKGSSMHGGLYFDAHRSYKDVLKDIKSGKIKIEK